MLALTYKDTRIYIYIGSVIVLIFILAIIFSVYIKRANYHIFMASGEQ